MQNDIYQKKHVLSPDAYTVGENAITYLLSIPVIYISRGVKFFISFSFPLQNMLYKHIPILININE